MAPSLQVNLSGGAIDNIFALGDVAESGGPKMARAAECQSQIAASNIVSLIKSTTAPGTYQPVLAVEGAIKLTLGKVCYLSTTPGRVPTNVVQSAVALYSEDGSGDDALISVNAGQHEDGDIKRGWKLLGAKYDEAIAVKEQ